ncbi:hypothetical protein AB0K88_24305 [Streptomyces werraensis]|uniref:hypothetical protein n=1 Tax=Streptomyces werraensis TaxID=68284 RepID=UPI00341655F3
MAKPKKRLSAPSKPTQGKQIVLPAKGKLPGAGSSHERVCWRFTHADMEGRWGLQQFTTESWHAVLGRLVQFETMTVQEIRESSVYTEYDLPSGLLPEALRRLEDLNLGDMTKIGRFRIWSKPRLYGFMEGNVFHVLWWDPEHEIYPWEPRNT